MYIAISRINSIIITCYESGGGGGGAIIWYFTKCWNHRKEPRCRVFQIRAQNRNIQLCAQPQHNWKLCMFSSVFMLNLMVFQGLAVLFKPILALHIINFSSCRNNWGGGAQNDISPNILMGGGGGGRLPPAPPPPPRIDASCKEY